MDDDQKLTGIRVENRKRKSRQLRYLAQSVRLEEAVAPRVVRLSILVITLAVFAFIIWASVTRVEEITRVQGEITPLGFQQVVQHLEGGIVKEIAVKEGDIVEPGDLLVRLESVDTSKDLERTRLKLLNLELQYIRLQAQVTGEDPDYSKFEEEHPLLVADQMNMYRAAVNAEDKERDVLIDQISQRKNSIDILKTRQETTINNLHIVKQLYDKRKKLNEDGVISDVRFLETKQRLNDLKGEVENLQNQIVVAEISLKEFEKRLESLDASNKDEDFQNLETVEQELIQTREVMAKLEDRSQRLDLRAPTRGIVKGLEVNTIGSVVQSGQLIMEIVPLDKQLVAMVRIPPENIGYVNVGDPVKLKVSTYDFSRYGTVPGSLEFISAATFVNEDGNSYYNGRVILQQNYVGDDPAHRVLPGMTVIADIIIGKKTIMQYLLKPIHQSLRTAFTER
jgi:membrane fusion protein, adhesin transport system